MRRRHILALPTVLAVAGCAPAGTPTDPAPSPAQTPEDVVRGYVAALATNDRAAMAKYLTPEYGTLLQHATAWDAVASVTDVTIVGTYHYPDGLDPDTTRNYQYVRVKVRFTAKLTHPYHLKQGANLLDCVLIRRNSAQPWRITSDTAVNA